MIYIYSYSIFDLYSILFVIIVIYLTAKATSEYAIMNTRYNEYTKVTYEQLINIANNWILEEADLGAPLFTFNGTIVGVGQKKIKKKSELQLQVTTLFRITNWVNS